MGRRAQVVLAISTLLAVPSAARADGRLTCSGDAHRVRSLSIVVDGRPDRGFYIVPSRRPTGLVVFSHGFQSAPTRYGKAMTDVAQATGVITVAMYNPGEKILAGGNDTRGWRVREGARAAIAVAELFDRACPRLGAGTFVDYGVSMGGNTSGLIAATRATRTSGRALFDYWFDVEGVTNVIETYVEARVVAPTGNATATAAIAAIEEENGGRTITDDPAAYRDLAVVSHARDIAAAGIKGVVMVHGAGDGLVPHDQTREMEALLTQAGVPTDVYTALTKSPGTDSGTTLDGDAPVPHDSPASGHGGEGDETQTTTGTALKLLTETLRGKIPPPSCHREFLVDGTTRTLQPDPAATRCQRVAGPVALAS
jgi:hypothetical protein